MPMSDDYQRIELITGTARRRRWTTEQKLRIIEASYAPGESVSSVARRHGVAPNLLYRPAKVILEDPWLVSLALLMKLPTGNTPRLVFTARGKVREHW